MINLLVCLVVGMLLGAIFAFFKLPAPAPGTLAGVLGVAGVYVGYQVVLWLMQVARSG
jgi:XapX domain-containing protein